MANTTTARASAKKTGGSSAGAPMMKQGLITAAEKLGFEVLYNGDVAYGFSIGEIEYTKASQWERLVTFVENRLIPGLPVRTRKVH